MLMVRYNKKRMKKRRSSTFRILFISNKTFFFSLFSFYMHFFNFKIQVIPSCVYLSIWIDKRKKERKKKEREKMEIVFYFYKKEGSIDLNDQRVAWRLTLLVCI